MKKRFSGLCPCGYGFLMSGSEAEAIAVVQKHVERWHTDFLPFGLTDLEARQLLAVKPEKRSQRNLKKTKSDHLREKHFDNKWTRANVPKHRDSRVLPTHYHGRQNQTK